MYRVQVNDGTLKRPRFKYAVRHSYYFSNKIKSNLFATCTQIITISVKQLEDIQYK